MGRPKKKEINLENIKDVSPMCAPMSYTIELVFIKLL